ncbi:VanZ family protein [Flavobacterium sp.]|uniref:VanZ family protein n=1 Tax=Flavobacterium sp. TaxID=239 RepID=UPI002627835B|nr:VanZ family protein [Flavobacterium sp.]
MKTIKPLSERKDLFLFLAIIWTFFIAYLCLARFKSLPKIGLSGADKYVHVILYFVFTSLWSFYLKAKASFSNASLVKVVFAAIVYGSAIEIAQGLFTTTRKADIMDVLANTSGSILAVMAILIGTRFAAKKI